ncbi:type III secretion system translocon subunit SctE [Burkholderia sp. Bp8986]|uniref:type III secretion system translocon subunit SctE n=1 Tax=Burkholderia sp. Bp8986 TaxID=2184550 RepID=UPI000F59496D|nr:type III secretion system translocon subunit SctE [Burkholderia sp. Bp8986]RQS43768.1 hypothetical protein DID99_34945 [Burkholderia sp. Bp8986]
MASVGEISGVQGVNAVRGTALPAGKAAAAGVLDGTLPVSSDNGKSDDSQQSPCAMLSAPRRRASPEAAEQTVKALFAALVQGFPGLTVKSAEGEGETGAVSAASGLAQPPATAVAFYMSSPDAMAFAIGVLVTNTLMANVSVDSKTYAALDEQARQHIAQQGADLQKQITEQAKKAHMGVIQKIFSLVMDVVSFVIDLGTAAGELLAADPQGVASLTCAALDLAQLGLQVADDVDPSKSGKFEKAMDAVGGLQMSVGIIGMAVGAVVARRAVSAATEVGESVMSDAGGVTAKVAIDAAGEAGGTAATMVLTGVDDAGSNVTASLEELGSTIREEEGATQGTLDVAAKATADNPVPNGRLSEPASKPTPSSGMDSKEVEAVFQGTVERAGNTAETLSVKLTKSMGAVFERGAVGDLVVKLLTKAMEDNPEKWADPEVLEAMGKDVKSTLTRDALRARSGGAAGLAKLAGNAAKIGGNVGSGTMQYIQANDQNAANQASLDAQRVSNALTIGAAVRNTLAQQMQKAISDVEQVSQTMSDLLESDADLSNAIARYV